MVGKVKSIHVAPQKAAVMKSVAEVEAIAGKGLRGDRYFEAQGTFSRANHEPDHELTLVEAEAVDALARDYKVELSPGDTRRNIVTMGISLNHLVGREFSIGDVRVLGIRLCEPCSHLERLTVKGVRCGLIHRGGLRAQILTGGTIRVGDVVEQERVVRREESGARSEAGAARVVIEASRVVR